MRSEVQLSGSGKNNNEEDDHLQNSSLTPSLKRRKTDQHAKKSTASASGVVDDTKKNARPSTSKKKQSKKEFQLWELKNKLLEMEKTKLEKKQELFAVLKKILNPRRIGSLAANFQNFGDELVDLVDCLGEQAGLFQATSPASPRSVASTGGKMGTTRNTNKKNPLRGLNLMTTELISEAQILEEMEHEDLGIYNHAHNADPSGEWDGWREVEDADAMDFDSTSNKAIAAATSSSSKGNHSSSKMNSHHVVKQSSGGKQEDNLNLVASSSSSSSTPANTKMKQKQFEVHFWRKTNVIEEMTQAGYQEITINQKICICSAKVS